MGAVDLLSNASGPAVGPWRYWRGGNVQQGVAGTLDGGQVVVQVKGPDPAETPLDVWAMKTSLAGVQRYFLAEGQYRAIIRGGTAPAGVYCRLTRIAEGVPPLHQYVVPPGLIWDDFIGRNNLALRRHRPEISPGGVAWSPITPDNGAPSVNSVRLKNNEVEFTIGAEGVAIDTGHSDVDILINCRYGTATKWGLILRASANGEMLVLRHRQPEALIELTSWDAGAVTVIGTAQTLAATAGQNYRYIVRALGGRVTVWRDDVQVLDETGVVNHQAATMQGFTCFGSSFDERLDSYRCLPTNHRTPIPG